MNDLKIVEYEEYGDMGPNLYTVHFIEVRTKNEDGTYKKHSTWYGNADVSKVRADLMKNPVQYVEFIKSRGYKKLKVTKVQVGE